MAIKFSIRTTMAAASSGAGGLCVVDEVFGNSSRGTPYKILVSYVPSI
jgi:hypothetical protein